MIYHGGRERMKKDCPTYVERGKCKREWAVNIGGGTCARMRTHRRAFGIF